MNTFIKYVLACLAFMLLSEIYAQTPRKKEDRTGRMKYEYEMYKNPKTGYIPENIRKQELQYVRSAKSQLNIIHKKKVANRLADSQTWSVRGPFNQGGRTRAVGIDSRDENILFAGGTSGGMYRSTDGGTSWSSVTDPLANPSITGVAQNPLSLDTWYYITGESLGSVSTNQAGQKYIGDGVYQSLDNGVSWTQIPSTDPEDPTNEGSGARSDWQLCSEIVIDPIDGAILVANTGGIYRSSNDGVSWTLVLDAKGLTQFGDVTHLDVAKVDASNRVYYASTHSSGTNKGFFRSTDGVSWSQIPNPSGFGGEWERIIVSIAKSNTDVVWFLAEGSQLTPSTSQLLKYDHNITTWTDFTSKLPAVGGDVGDFNTQGSYNMVMAVKPDDENVVFIGDTKLWRSVDAFASNAVAANTGNTTWVGGYSPDNNISSYPGHHPDVHEFVFFPNNPNKALCGHDGGLSVTTDVMANDGVPSGKSEPHPITWTPLNNGLFTTQSYAISIDPSTSGSKNIISGFQDNGNYRTTLDGASTPWDEEPYGGDGAWNATVSGGDTWYISQQYGTVERNSASIPIGPGVNPSAAGQSSTNTFISPFILDRVDADIMYYAAKKDLWRNNTISTINIGGAPFDGTSEGWTNLSLSATLNGNITALETSVSPANVLYIGTSSGEVYKISDANSGSSATLTDIFTGKSLSTGFISSIDIDPDDANNVFITFSNYGIVSIYHSSDGGTNWINISGNLEENVDGTGSGPGIRWIHVFKKTDNSNVYYVGATTGLYSTETLNGTSTSWTQEGSNTIGNVPVSMIRSRKVDGYIAVGTHGKGMFSATFSATDVTPPTISSTNPADNATDIVIISDLVVTFDENIADAGGSVIVKKGIDDSIVESMLVSSGNITISNTTVTINPTNDLDAGTAYYVEIEASAIKDAADNAFVGISDKTTWNFTTEVTDVTAPTINSLSPSDNATNIAINSNLMVTFDENIADNGGSVIIKRESDDSIVESLLVSSGDITISNATVTINPTSDLDGGTSYYIEIEVTAFKDVVGNSFSGISDKTTWNFTTADITTPTIIVTTPSDGAVDVAIGASLVIIFSEDVLDGGGAIIIKKEADDSTVESIVVSSSGVNISNSTVIINPTNDLATSTSYYVEIEATAFKDVADNDFAGISDKTTWNFTTIDPDITSPIVMSFDPADGTNHVAQDINLTITFDENITDGSGNLSIKKVSDNSTVEAFTVASSNVVINNAIVTITPTNDLPHSTSFYIEIDETAFKDESGNFYAGITNSSTWDFTTLVIDTSPPVITTLSPPDDATDVNIDEDLVITFDEEVVVGSGSVILKYDSDDSTIESISVSSSNITITNNEITINPTSDLLPESTYYLEIEATAFEDTEGNTFRGISDKTTWNFTTISITGIEEHSIKDLMNVTPFQHGVHVEFLGTAIDRVEINLYSLDGRLATYRSKVYMKNNTAKIKASLKPGIYILVATTQQGVFSNKFLVK